MITFLQETPGGCAKRMIVNREFWGMNHLVSEDSNRYAHLFLIEREYFGNIMYRL